MDFLVGLLYAAALIPAVRAIRRRRYGDPRGIGGGVRLSIALLGLLIVGRGMLSLYVDALWFHELGAERRFWTELGARWTTFAIGTVVAFAVLWANAFLVRRAGRGRPHLTAVAERERPAPGRGLMESLELGGGRWTLTDQPAGFFRLLGRLRTIALAALALLLGAALAANWWTFLVYLHQQPFGQHDPQFGRDVAFYVFTLPAWRVVQAWLTSLVLVTMLATAALYILPAALAGLAVGGWATPLRRGARHLGILVGVLFLLGAWRVLISRYELVFSRRGPLVGVSAVDAKLGATLLVIYALLLVALAIGAVVLANRYRLRVALIFIGLWIGGAVFLLGIVPALYEALAVRPEQLRAEMPYIQRHLAMTRAAFNLDTTHVAATQLPEPPNLAPAALLQDATTIQNLRLADWRPLLHTYNQLQTLRTYYRFVDVDVDRYTVGGAPRAVMLSLRELDSSKVPARESGRGWDINRWFIYTHGYGACMNSVNSFSAEGIPDLLIRDVPPVAEAPELSISRPEVYFGEITTTPIMVRARGQQEFDYPRGDRNIFTTYEGRAGIPVGHTVSLRRLAFALRFHSINFFLSTYIGPQTRVLFARDLDTRLERLAPFLRADHDPYAVLRDDGSLALVRDFYTTTSRYPYAARAQGVNYIRNSIKAVLDCYHGTVRLYVVDESDPLARTFRAVYPDLFEPKGAVPPDIERHFRYPEDMLGLQAQVYGTYHVHDPVTFYNHEDVWEVGQEILEGQHSGTTVPVIPYYMLMRLPTEPRVEFLQMIPLTPRDKDNMIAWVAGLCDPGRYGRLVAYHLPKGTIAYGPRQIEARIDQDPTISRDLSLWNQMGSQVLRGNLLTVPVGGAFLYVEPLYLQSTGGKIPELKRVIVATQRAVGYGSSLAEALGNLFGQQVAALAPASAEGGTPAPANAGGAPGGGSAAAGGVAGPAGNPAVNRNLQPGSPLPAGGVAPAGPSAADGARIRSAAEHLRRYQALMGQGRAAEAGRELDALAQDLQALQAR